MNSMKAINRKARKVEEAAIAVTAMLMTTAMRITR